MVFNRGHELGEVAVADDPSELLLGLEHPGSGPALALAAVQRLRMSPSCQRLTLRWVWRTISIIDSIGLVEDSVFESWPVIPRRISVSVSGSPSRSDAPASGQARSSSEASRELLLGLDDVGQRPRSTDPGEDLRSVAFGE